MKRIHSTADQRGTIALSPHLNRSRLQQLGGLLLSGTWIAALLLIGCDNRESDSNPLSEAVLHTFQQGHMGTLMTIRIWAEAKEAAEVEVAAEAAFARIAHLESLFTDYESDSEVVRLALENAPGTPVSISKELFEILSLGEALARQTGGAFDVTIGPMVRLWRLSRKNHRLPTDDRISDARHRTGWEKISLDPEKRTATLAVERMQIDLGGIAKGYAADAALGLLKEMGFPHSLVAASGDIVVGAPPANRDAWRIGIRSLDVADSDDRNDLSGTVDLVNAAISTSGDTEQAINIDGVRYSHIVDPDTGLGKTKRIAVTVIGPNATTTDSHATAVSVLGREKGLAFIESLEGIECLIVEKDETGTIAEFTSSGFPEVDEVKP